MPEELHARLDAPLRRVGAAFVAYMRACGIALVARDNPPPLTPVDSALEAFGKEIAAVRTEGLTRSLTADAAERFFALG